MTSRGDAWRRLHMPLGGGSDDDDDGEDGAAAAAGLLLPGVGLTPQHVHVNCSRPVLHELALRLRSPAAVAVVSSGALAASSGAIRGRSPAARRLVAAPAGGGHDDVWWGARSPNVRMDERAFLANREAAMTFLAVQRDLFVVDGFAGHGQVRASVRVLTAAPHHALFATNMLVAPSAAELAAWAPCVTVFDAGAFPANSFMDAGNASHTSIDVSLVHRQVVILGTQYAGEMKKALWALLHYLLPVRRPLLLHSACNVGPAGDVSLFLGLSGTGKTALSSDLGRCLVGDDEHCWHDEGVTNLEGGCYAKVAHLLDAAPDVAAAIRFGALLENVVYDPASRQVDYADTSITENARACYPLSHVRGALVPAVAGHPANLLLLCCDAAGVLPLVARLSRAQALYHFVSGYSAKLAGTEQGVGREPAPTFSPCYAGPFLVWHPLTYATRLAERLAARGSHTQAWLLNTGWMGGGAGGGGRRVPLAATRAIIDAIHSGELAAARCTATPVFRLQAPLCCSGVDAELLQPAAQWPSAAAYAAALQALAQQFADNFALLHHDARAAPELLQLICSGAPQLPGAGEPDAACVVAAACAGASQGGRATKLAAGASAVGSDA